jgi:hypothetical protein
VVGKEVELKGQWFRGLLDAVDHLFGAEVRDRVVDTLPDAPRLALKQGRLIPSGWYPIAWNRDLHAAARSVLPDEKSLAHRLGAVSTERDLNGVYRAFGRVLGLGMLLKIYARIWQTYCDSGTITITPTDDEGLAARVDGFYGANGDVWSDVLGSSEAYIRATGRRPAIRVLAGGGDNDSYLSIKIGLLPP